MGSYSYSPAGPPQPEWRIPPAHPPPPSWSPSPVSPPPPPLPPHPNTHSHGVNMDPTTWGVRYNRQQHAATPPPLPPRPSSTPHHPPTAGTSPAVSPIEPNKPSPASPSYGHDPWAAYYSYGPQVSPDTYAPPPPPPPPPPPITSPPEDRYASPQLVNNSAERPLPQPPPFEPPPAISSATHEYGSYSTAPPPVPPKTSYSALPTSSPAPGSFGGPSDWEHLSHVPGDIDDVEIFSPGQGAIAHANAPAELPPSHLTSLHGQPPSCQPGVSPPFPAAPAIQTTQFDDSLAAENQHKDSPVSSGTGQEFYEPPQPARVNSGESEHSAVSAAETSESIDGVIEAWKKPVSAEPQVASGQEHQSPNSANHTASPQRLSPIEATKPSPALETSGNDAHPREANAERKDAVGHTTKMEDSPLSSKPLDPYENLEPWSKSSLERFVAMLRKEQVADSDAERFKIFKTFMSKEVKLREILYNVEYGPQNSDEADQQPPSIPDGAREKEPEGKASPIESGLIPVETEDDMYKPSSFQSEELEDGQYSPGGRPILPRLHTPVSAGLQRSASQPMSHRYGPENSTQDPGRSTSVPPSMTDGQELAPLTTNPPQAIYTPFRYTEGPQRGSDDLAFDRPAYQAYSALRQASADSGRIMSNGPGSTAESQPSPTTNTQAPTDRDETFIGLIREKSVAYRSNTPRKTSSPPSLPASLRHGKPSEPIDELRSMVSRPLAKQSESSWHVTTKKELEKFSNDFRYIPEKMKSWEAISKARREELDKERMRRQEESEQHIDMLFNEKEIGYADINTLEEDFRQIEARAQLDEERRELEDFIKEVFDPLDQRLQEEISTLRAQYDSTLTQLDHENSRAKDSVTDKYSLSHTMAVVNEVYQKLELRYQQRLNIALDRERRRKKTERRPLVFMGDSPGLKRLDSDFDQMERRNILEAARDRDERANRLMDSFDDAIVHGLGENQSLLDEIASKVASLDAAAALSTSSTTDSEVEQILKSVFTLVESLRQDSESILEHFGAADHALNNADYRVSVAEARYSNAQVDELRRLDLEKKKEDAKIEADLKSKLDSIRAGPARITGSINRLLESIGKEPLTEHRETIEEDGDEGSLAMPEPGPLPAGDGAGGSSKDEDPDHQQRIRKALEDAKKRNAARNN